MSPEKQQASSEPQAAQYVRVSTDQQRYSIENQAAALAAYAARRNVEIVRTYRDLRSGLQIAGRDGLQELIRDVQSGHANFDCILVYDVSRWGRFQDVDESAYYEFICKRAGIKVHYCADEFENDGSLASVVLKNIKRIGAADYSRQLSKKVFLGQCRVAAEGYWRGGPAVYGLRRLLLDETGKRKCVLEHGQRKNLSTERVILVPGPKSEVRVIQRIFRSFVIEKKTRTDIASELNAEGVQSVRGGPWSMFGITKTLKNEVYIGNMIFNRLSSKLGERRVTNPSDMWIRCDNAFQPIISPSVFAKAQKRLTALQHGRVLTDQELLDRLTILWRRKGHLTVKLMDAAKDVPNVLAYKRRFGSITAAYKRIGFKVKARYDFTGRAAKIDGIICSVAANIINKIEKRGSNATYLRELYLITVGGSSTLAITVAWSVRNGSDRRLSMIRRLKYWRADLTLILRMDRSNVGVQEYFLLPTSNLPKHGRMSITDRAFGEFRLTDLNAVVKALHDRLRVGNMARRR